jgi:hypothetical protein
MAGLTELAGFQGELLHPADAGYVPEEATAFSGREAGYALNINAVATHGDGYPGAGRLGPPDVGGHGTPRQRRLRQLPRPGGQRPGPGRLRRGQVPPVGRAQACLGPRQPVPPNQNITRADPLGSGYDTTPGFMPMGGCGRTGGG